MTMFGCTIVFYHYVRDAERTPFPAIKALSVAGFAAQLDWLQARYDVIGGPAVEQAVQNRTAFSRPTALLTFDDGFIDHYEHVFPVLQARQLGGIFFIAGATLAPRPMLLNVHKTHFLLARLGADQFAAEVGDALEREGVDVRSRTATDATLREGREGIYRYDEAPETRIKRVLNYDAPHPIANRVLTTLFERHIGDSVDFARALYVSATQIGEMARGGMTFGFHTETHPVLSRLDRAQQRAELRNGPGLVRSLTGQQAVSFCFPHGFLHTYNADTLDVLDECGYSAAFNTERREADIGRDPRFELPRFDTRDVARPHEVRAGA
jgi:peptidoglycan/xylan/chitin deacetylase (PgdA/CDA1 family)